MLALLAPLQPWCSPVDRRAADGTVAERRGRPFIPASEHPRRQADELGVVASDKGPVRFRSVGHRWPRGRKMRIRNVTAVLMTVCIAGVADAATRITLSDNVSGGSLVFDDAIGPRELNGTSAVGSAVSRGQAIDGGLKSSSGVSSTTSGSFISGFATVELHDTVHVDAGGALNGQTGFATVRLDYRWHLGYVPGVEAGLTGASTAGDISVLLNNQGAYAREYRYAGTAYADSEDIALDFVPLGDSVARVGSTLGSYMEFRVPITFGDSLSLHLSLSTSTQALNGVATADAFNSAYWGGAKFYDSNMTQVSATAFGATGVDYTRSFTPAVPEPSTLLLAAAGAAVVALRRPRT